MITLITLIATVMTFMSGDSIDNVNVYPQTFAVVEVDTENDVVTVVDTIGNEWAFDGAEDWHRGDLVSAIMTDMGTESIYDDEFVSVKYAGFVHDTFGWDSSVEMPIVDFSERD